jgi:HPt (histidine-containing phosphotransfer) domain-containing protein
VIERAIAALASDRLDTDLRRDAERAAHMLAGSIGMFGFIRASKAARDLELQLAHPTPDRVPALSALLLRVRGGVEGPVVLCSDTAAVEVGVHEDSYREPWSGRGALHTPAGSKTAPRR